MIIVPFARCGVGAAACGTFARTGVIMGCGAAGTRPVGATGNDTLTPLPSRDGVTVDCVGTPLRETEALSM